MKLPKFFLFFFLSLSLLFIVSFLLPPTCQAASLYNAKDTITTSRPSALSTLSLGATAPATPVYFTDNNTRFLASDSAMLIGGPGANETMTVASMSAISGSTAALYFTAATAGNHNIGTTVMVPVTAQHVVSFTTVNAVPGGGRIQVTLPVGDTAKQSYPSPNGFSFNSLASGNLSVSFSPSGPTCGSWTITPASGLVQCNVGTGITGPSTVTINIGLSNTNPVLINPSKTAAAGTADTWSVQLKTTDSAGIEIDSARTKIGTIDSVEVYATVEPTFTFTIGGIGVGESANYGNTTGCTSTDVTNTGFASTATEVNLGVLSTSTINIGAQLITITTNGGSGYTLTATSSGFLIDPSVGYWVVNAQGGAPTANNTPIPAALVAGTSAFGIHPCGLDVTTSSPDWGEGAGQTCTTGSGTNCYYANPSPTYYYTLAQDTVGPVGNSITAGNGLTTVEYATTISISVPAGLYKTVLTYVATPGF